MQQNILANTGIDICAANRLYACIKVESVFSCWPICQALHWASEEILLNQWLLSSRMTKTSQLRSHTIFEGRKIKLFYDKSAEEK